jgi:hypothetical protein
MGEIIIERLLHTTLNAYDGWKLQDKLLLSLYPMFEYKLLLLVCLIIVIMGYCLR